MKEFHRRPELVRWMALALEQASLSPDPRSQNGAVLLDRDGRPIAADCNRPPGGTALAPERLVAPAKYEFFEHAERTVIFQAARRGHATNGATLICPWAACAPCARALALAGVSSVVRLSPGPGESGPQWTQSLALADGIFADAGVSVIEIGLDEVPSPASLVRNGKAWPPRA